MQVKVNVNDYVKVKLNKKGLEIHKNDFMSFWEDHPNRNSAFVKYKEPAVDEQGYRKFPLWELMQIFGRHLRLGEQVPFDTEIIFDKE